MKQNKSEMNVDEDVELDSLSGLHFICFDLNSIQSEDNHMIVVRLLFIYF